MVTMQNTYEIRDCIESRPSHLISSLSNVLSESAEALEKWAVIVVVESRHRVRYLPIGRVENN